MPPNDAPSPASDIVMGLAAIGRLFGRSRWTVRRWIEREGFPAAKLPDGSWVTELELIRRWILVRRPYSLTQSNAERTDDGPRP